MLGPPGGLEQPVGEAQAEDVERGLHGEEVVDAEDGVLGHQPVQHLVERPGVVAVPAERLLDDDPRAVGHADLLQRLERRQEDGVGQGEVDDRRAVHPLQRRPQVVGGGDVAGDVAQPGEQVVADVLGQVLRVRG